MNATDMRYDDDDDGKRRRQELVQVVLLKRHGLRFLFEEQLFFSLLVAVFTR